MPEQNRHPLTGVVGELVTCLRAHLEDEIQRRVRAAGFTDARPAHDSVWRYVHERGVRLKELADQSGMTPQSIGEHVTELEERGYVERVPDPSDGRAKLVRPTVKGVAYLAATRRVLEEIEEQWVAAVGADALTQVCDTLAAIDARLGQSAPA